MDEDQARAEAEARRQRILDSAAGRMDRVNGLVAGSEAENPVEEKKASSSSKMAAMRKRRFRKSAAKDESSSTATAAATEQASKTAAEKPKEATPAPVAETKKVAPKPVDDARKVEEKPKPTATTTATGASTDKESPPKKYMGVAKMRRKMIQEKKQKQMEEQAEETPVSIPKKFSKVSAAKPTWPILMHLLTIFFLWFAGFEVGLQQSVIEYRDDLTIHDTLAPQQEIRLLTKGNELLASFSPTPTIVKDVDADKKPPTPYLSKEKDEFELDKDEEPAEENLDPLFGVDLDALTAGPGFFMFFCRYAVRAHRVILSFVYYLPMRLWNNLLSLVASPPVLCLASLIIRQISHLLGGKLPALAAEEGKTSTQPQDVMATISNMVTGFLGKAFPTATKIYDAWTHLRSDMYVVMCGLFVGLVWHHYLSTLDLATTGDEL